MDSTPVVHSIVIPIYNEEGGIAGLYARMKKVVDAIGEPWEVIFVNDGSRDRSGELLDELHAKDNRFKVIHFSRNFGHQIALTAGIEYAVGQTVTGIDGDLQDPPEVILQFIEKWREGFEVVYGQRRTRAGENWFKLVTAKVFYRAIRFITQLDIPVDTGDFRLIDRKVADAFIALPERHRYVRGLMSWVGFRQVGVAYDRAPREIGETHYPLSKMVRLAFDAVASFSTLPLRLASAVGFLTSVSAFAVAAWALYTKYFAARAVPGWTSQILVILLLGGAQLFCMGMLGEYLGRTFDEVRRRPLYFVTRLTGFSRTPAKRGSAIDRVA